MSDARRFQLAVAVSEEEPRTDPFVFHLHQQVARLLGHEPSGFCPRPRLVAAGQAGQSSLRAKASNFGVGVSSARILIVVPLSKTYRLPPDLVVHAA